MSMWVWGGLAVVLVWFFFLRKKGSTPSLGKL